MALIPAAAAIGAATAATAAGAWLDKKFNISEDIAQIRSGQKNAQYVKHISKLRGDWDWSFYHILHCTYGLNENTEAFLFEDRLWTYGEFRCEIGRLANEFSRLGIKNRSVVGMYINNSPEFVFAWWALFKIGAVPAPINTSISEEPFRHCLRVSESEFVICSYELFEPAARSLTAQNHTSPGTPLHSEIPLLKSMIVYDYGTYPAIPISPPSISLVIHSELEPVTTEMGDWPAGSRPRVGPLDTAQYLFTSGTTGLPKAARWPSAWSLFVGSPHRWPGVFAKYRRFYLCTPMFHGGAAFACLPSTHTTSGTVVLARKFSRKNFWHDIRRTRSNGIFYIGEMIRYLVQAPKDPRHPDEKKMHTLEVIYGLGLAPPIWRAFRERFGVPWIVEYYGASEGTGAIINSNHSNKAGVAKVAHWGPLMRSKWFGQQTFYIIKIDFETGEVIRNPKTGLCVRAGWGEIGEAINRITPPVQAMHEYIGEYGRKATQEKTLRDVFQKGDLFWRMGDALSMDRDGWITFHDRLGDTYRAKGHNISTAEVEMAFISHPHISSANVFAVSMAKFGYEGQVGCAAITFRAGAPVDTASTTERESLADLEHWLITKAGLPSYGVPRFIRVLVDDQNDPSRDLGRDTDVGSERVSLIMKKLKTGLRKDGFNPASGSSDRMYWLEREGRGYVELSPDTRQLLVAGRARL